MRARHIKESLITAEAVQRQSSFESNAIRDINSGSNSKWQNDYYHKIKIVDEIDWLRSAWWTRKCDCAICLFDCAHCFWSVDVHVLHSKYSRRQVPSVGHDTSIIHNHVTYRKLFVSVDWSREMLFTLGWAEGYREWKCEKWIEIKHSHKNWVH